MNCHLICEAIKERKLIEFFYEDGVRIVEPFACGYGRKGNLLLRAFQIEGYSKSGKPLGWKLFRVDKISQLRILEEIFNDYREGYNPLGDSQIPNIICKV